MPPTDIIILLGAAALDKKVAKMLLSGDIDVQKIRKTLTGVDEAMLPEKWALTEEEIGRLKNIKVSTLAEFAQRTIESGLLTGGQGNKEIKR